MSPLRVRIFISALLTMMVGQFSILLFLGKEPYPAIIFPSFARVPVTGGAVNFSIPDVLVRFQSGDSLFIAPEQVFSTIPPRLISFVYGTIEKKQTAAMRRAELLRPEESKSGASGEYHPRNSEFSSWILKQTTRVVGNEPIEQIVLRRKHYLWKLEDIPGSRKLASISSMVVYQLSQQ